MSPNLTKDGCTEPMEAGPVDSGPGDLILVVDDEPQIREMTAPMLSRRGYRVITAGDGIKALALFAARPGEIRLVITDLILPRLDGATLARVARELNPSVQVLAMTGLGNDREGSRIELFAHMLLYKPFKAQSLFEAVRTLLAPARQA